MGLFSGSSSHHDSDWSEQFDRKMASGASVDRGMRGKPRVQDDSGNWFTREGTGCCGCGRNRNMGDRDQYGIPEGDPDVGPNGSRGKHTGGIGQSIGTFFFGR